ncbi:MAG: RNA-binding protein, partial [Bacilli bacterium]|nr:RNA-binding protein [Bacilli bacterium]
LEILKKKDVILNYQEVTNGAIQVKEGDIFSIRHVGKFRLGSTLKSTKKQKRVVEIWKYL